MFKGENLMKKKEMRFSVPDNQAVAMVMFCNSDSLWFLKLLKAGRRHCFVAIKSGQDWIVYEPLLARTEISIIKNADSHYVRECFEQIGCEVVGVSVNRTTPIKKSLFAPFTCVRAVAKVLGVPTNILCTPNKLYKILTQ